VISQREVVLLSFPFSDGRGSKVRPAIVMSNDSYNGRSEDFIAVPLTSNLRRKEFGIPLTNADMESGNLVVESRAKVDRVFSVSQSLVRMKVGRIKPAVHRRLVSTLLELVE
jgi:mRNA interferase MazF